MVSVPTDGVSNDVTDPVDRMNRMATAWARMTGSVVRTVTAANRAGVASLGVAARSDGDAAERPTERPPASIPSLSYEEGDWSFERSVDTRDEIAVGDTVRFSKRITEDDVRRFARVSGDTNRLHLDDEFAGRTRFDGRIAHGTLVSGVISAALARLPGLTIYLSQDLQFRNPVAIGDRITAVVEVVEDLGRNQYRLSTVIVDEDHDRTVIDGEAVVLIDELPEE